MGRAARRRQAVRSDGDGSTRAPTALRRPGAPTAPPWQLVLVRRRWWRQLLLVQALGRGGAVEAEAAGPFPSGSLASLGASYVRAPCSRAAGWLPPAARRRPQECVYFLNRGSQIEVHYSVKPETVSIYSLCIIIAQGNGSFTRWTEKSPVHSTTLSWRLVHGTGTIKQTIDSSHEYYIAVRNLDDHDTTVLLDFRISAVLYNTTGADFACSPGKSPCTYRLPILGQNAAVLSSGFKERLNSNDDEQYSKVELSYVPRWIVYVLGSAILAVSLLLLYEVLCSLFGFCTWGSSSGYPGDQRTSLLANKEEDEDASMDSSYDSVSDDDDDDVEESGEAGAGRHLCVVCCDARKDCFFLPCGHSATCHTCGTRIQEGDGSCPICRRKLKKVRRIFAV